MPVDFKLYLITDRHITKMPLPEAVHQALMGGVRAVQLREKDLPVRELLALARELRNITEEFRAKLFINDRVDVAVAVDADGVHLGGQSLPASAVRKVVGNRMIIGVSTHSIREAKEAEEDGADFITYGPIFATLSKALFGNPVGCESIFQAKKAVKVPIFALGGIKSGNISQVMAAGSDGIAMISAILAADDIRKAAEDMIKQLSSVPG
jgi:thiamine-phosphate pyrophosphorylase